MNGTRPYWSPYVAGVALGVTLLATYLLMGFGLGASGAFAQVAARLEGVVAPGRAQGNPYLVGYLEAGRLWAQWIVVEMVGVLMGAVLGAWTAGRFAWRLEKGPRIGVGRRLAFAFVGGTTVGFASRVAQGCTSGVALSGGAVLAPGAWAFLVMFMAGGFVTAWLERGGLGDPKKLTGLFYLEDFTMLKVMFAGIAVAAAGIGTLSLLGVLDLSRIAVQPTYLWPQAVGGLILGVGFALGGY